MYRLTSDASHVFRIEDGAFIPTDPENRDYQAFAAWQEAGNTPEPYVPSAPAVPASITRRQCAKQMKEMGLIDAPEALAMTRNGTPPAMAMALIQQLPADLQDDAQIDFAADTYVRSNPLLVALMTASGHDEAAIDAFFIAAAAL